MRPSCPNPRAIADHYANVEEVQSALRKGGLESSNLIVAVDFTKVRGMAQSKHDREGVMSVRCDSSSAPYMTWLGVEKTAG